MSSSFDSALLATACALYKAGDSGRVVVQRWARHASIAPFVNYRLCGEHADEFAIEQPHVGEICLICHAEALGDGDLVDEHLSELTADDTPESAMRKASDLVARSKASRGPLPTGGSVADAEARERELLRREEARRR